MGQKYIIIMENTPSNVRK